MARTSMGGRLLSMKPVRVRSARAAGAGAVMAAGAAGAAAGAGVAAAVANTAANRLLRSCKRQGVKARNSNGFRAFIVLLAFLPFCQLHAVLQCLALNDTRARRGGSWLRFFYGSNIVGAVIGDRLVGFYQSRMYDIA